MGDPAGALPAHLRAGVPRPAADLARGPAVPAPDRAGDRALRPVAGEQQRLVRDQRNRAWRCSSPRRCWRTAPSTRPARHRTTSPSSICGCRLAARSAACSRRWWRRRLFSEIYEYPLLLALSMACRPGALSFPQRQGEAEGRADRAVAHRRRRACWPSSQLPNLARAVGLTGSSPVGPWRRWSSSSWPPSCSSTCSIRRASLAALLMCLTIVALPSNVKQGDAQRSFFGVYRVAADRGSYRHLSRSDARYDPARLAALPRRGRQAGRRHGTDHLLLPGQPDRDRRSPSGARSWAPQKGRYGIVGLGTGSSSCHKQRGRDLAVLRDRPRSSSRSPRTRRTSRSSPNASPTSTSPSATPG